MSTFESATLALFSGETGAERSVLIANALRSRSIFSGVLTIVYPSEEETKVREDVRKALDLLSRKAVLPALHGLRKPYRSCLAEYFSASPSSHSLLIIGLHASIGEDNESGGHEPPLQEVRGKKIAIEESPCPVLLLPTASLLEDPPFTAVLVPMSQEKRQNEALSVGMVVANSLEIPLDVVSITPGERRTECDWACIAEYGDSFQHEYVRLVSEKLISATPFATPHERTVIRHVRHRHGAVAEEIIDIMEKPRHDLLVIEWKGSLAGGHARTLKDLILSANFPVLLVRHKAEAYFRLRAGKHL